MGPIRCLLTIRVYHSSMVSRRYLLSKTRQVHDVYLSSAVLTVHAVDKPNVHWTVVAINPKSKMEMLSTNLCIVTNIRGARVLSSCRYLILISPKPLTVVDGSLTMKKYCENVNEMLHAQCVTTCTLV